MFSLMREPSFLPSCILGGVGIIFMVLAFTLPADQVVALVGGSATVVGLFLARLRRDTVRGGSLTARLGAKV